MIHLIFDFPFYRPINIHTLFTESFIFYEIISHVECASVIPFILSGTVCDSSLDLGFKAVSPTVGTIVSSLQGDPPVGRALGSQVISLEASSGTP